MLVKSIICFILILNNLGDNPHVAENLTGGQGKMRYG